MRKKSYGVGVERTFPVHSPNIDHIEVVTRGDVRRAKLYYLRELRGKKARSRKSADWRSAHTPGTDAWQPMSAAMSTALATLIR